MAASTAPAPAHLRLVPALPLSEIQPDQPDQPATAADLLVCIEPTYWARYKGTRAQLEAEGVIPKDTKWPESGAKVCWEDGNLEFTLNRTRPDGMKGPMKLWLAGDYWCLDIDVKGRDWQWRARQNIEEKAKELAAEIRRHTPQAIREDRLRWDRYWKAHRDTAFQAFKAKFVPERKKPGRKPKAAVPAISDGVQA
ncbi:hypothetical protein [Ottowia thiooxydans]|uniref:hypothetical protein n=1 Tax=Ottowia thiooxydans TaxID=219182 RepID=UPI0004268A41|nr:hypothetical protein [Ottowia thiooxydans]